MSRKTVAVFGSTGGQGASVARALAQHPSRYMIRGITRDVNTTHAQQIRQEGTADLIPYNPSDPKSIQSAIAGCDAVFVNTVTDFADPDCLESEETRGQLIADACKAMGVSHVVYSSQLQTTRGALSRHMDAKAEVEEHMRRIELPVTLLIMPIYYEDFCGVFKPRSTDGRNFDLLLPTGYTPLDMMSVSDLGPAVVHVLENRDRYLHKTVSLSGDKLTVREVASVLNRHLAPLTFGDKQLSFHQFSQLDIPGALDWAQMFNFLVKAPQRHTVHLTRQLNPDILTFEQWVQRNKEHIRKAIV